MSCFFTNLGILLVGLSAAMGIVISIVALTEKALDKWGASGGIVVGGFFVVALIAGLAALTCMGGIS
jgi:hypothetical protein